MKPSLLKLSTSQTLSSRFPHIYTDIYKLDIVFLAFLADFSTNIYTDVLFFSIEGLNCITDTKVKQS